MTRLAWWSRLQFRRRVVLLVIATTVAALTLAVAALVFLHLLVAQDSRRRDQLAVARIVAANSAVALAFNNREDARDILASLHVHTAIVSAELRDPAGRTFAGFHSGRTSRRAARFLGVQAHLELPVRRDGDLLGTLHLVTDDFDELARLATLYSWAAPLIVCGAAGFAYLLGHLIQLRVTRPINELASLVEAVGVKGDYTVRAPAGGEDELGLLNNTLNQMLGRIQAQESELRTASEQLSEKVHALEHEIRERHRMEEERLQIERKLQEAQRLESLGVLAGGIAHDFNNLLAAILGHANLAALRLPPDSRAQDNVKKIELISLRAAELCRQMLAYSGQSQIITEPISMNQLIDETTQLIRVSVGKSIDLLLDLTPQLPLVVGDPPQIRQIILNLVINASEAIGPRPGRIRVTTALRTLVPAELSHVRLGSDAAPGNYIVVEVADDGPGMSPEVLTRIFEPFFTTKFTGRGLGLAAVLGIIRAHQGVLAVESTPGRGTSFRVFFPASTHLDLADARAAVAQRQGWRGTGTALIVDDEEPAREIVEQMCEVLGFVPLVAESGAEARQLFEENADTITVILVDYLMPQLNGVDTVRALLDAGARVPIFLMSGFTERDAMARLPEAAVAGFLQKPFSLDVLGSRLARALAPATGTLQPAPPSEEPPPPPTPV